MIPITANNIATFDIIDATVPKPGTACNRACFAAPLTWTSAIIPIIPASAINSNGPGAPANSVA